jgi:hypothetical protein
LGSQQNLLLSLECLLLFLLQTNHPLLAQSIEPVVEHHIYSVTICTSGKAADKLLFSVEPKNCQRFHFVLELPQLAMLCSGQLWGKFKGQILNDFSGKATQNT